MPSSEKIVLEPEGTRWIYGQDGTRLFSQKLESWQPTTYPTLVLCDGLGCAGYVWRYLIPQLRPQFSLIAWHYRGHGLSDLPKKAGAVDLLTLTQDLKRVLDAYQERHIVLVGHSMGAQLIFEFALQNITPIAGLVAMCGTFGQPLHTLRQGSSLKWLFPLLRNIVLRFPHYGQNIWHSITSSQALADYAWQHEVNPQALQPHDLWPYFQHLQTMDVRVFIRMLDSLRCHSVEAKLPQLQTPTLIIAGGQDSLTPAWLSRRMHRLLPQAELLVLPQATHVAPMEYPELVLSRLVQFVCQHMDVCP